MATMFQPLANLKDFDRSASSGAQLRSRWNALIEGQVSVGSATVPAFYHPLHPPVATPPGAATPTWTGLPMAIKNLMPGSIAEAAKFVDNPIAMGQPDPIFGPHYTPSFHDATGQVFPGQAYRPQDEYLEWVTRRDADGVVSEILFTCEGPEYWDVIAEDQQLLLDLYREIAEDTSVTLADLTFPRAVTWKSPNSRGGAKTFPQGSYNPYNKWNIRAAVHLTQPANTLSAEIALAKGATLLYGSPTPVTIDPDLICCAGYGEPNRMSDPTIGSGVNTQVRAGRRVTLRDPIGLYMQGVDPAAFALPDDSPFPHANDCFRPIRPAPADVKDMIVRARFRVPAGLTFGGKPLRVGDLKVKGEAIRFGGQVADVVNMRVFAQALPGAPAQQRVPCEGRPCQDANLPDFINVIPFSEQCPAAGVSPQLAHLAAPANPPQFVEVPDEPTSPLDALGNFHRARRRG